MTIKFIQMEFAGQVGVFPRIGRMTTTDPLSVVTTPGYLNNSPKTTGINFVNGDFIFAQYTDGNGNNISGQFACNVNSSNVVTLEPTSNGAVINGQAFLTTTNNTATSIITIPVPTGTGTILTATATLSAILSTGASSAYSTPSTAAAWYNGTSVAAVGSLPSVTMTNSGTFAVSAAWAVANGSLELQATGISSDTILWSCNYSYFTLAQ